MLFILVYWNENPSKRSVVLISSSILFPFVLYFFFLYTYLRHGSTIDISVIDAISLIVESETGFIRNAGNILVEKNVFADFSRYFSWVLTLFLPIGFVYKFEQIELNFEMSSHILGYAYGSGWYVNLPGPLAESIYIYGSYFFWVHFLLLGIFAAFLTKLFTESKSYYLLLIYITLILSYNFNRAGIASILPLLTNQFWLLYVFLIFYKVKWRGKA